MCVYIFLLCNAVAQVLFVLASLLLSAVHVHNFFPIESKHFKWCF